MKGAGNSKGDDLSGAGRPSELHRLSHALAVAAQDDLTRRIEVGGHADTVFDPGADVLDHVVVEPEHRRHRAGSLLTRFEHELPAQANRRERLLEREGPGGDMRTELTEGVACGERHGADSILDRPQHGDRVCEQGRLCVHRGRQGVQRALRHQGREGKSEHFVGGAQDVCSRRLGLRQRGGHAHVLRSLTREDQRE